jgi:hypothetical protein
MKLQEAIEKMTRLEHVVGVYDWLMSQLDQFLPNDTGDTPSEMAVEKTQFTVQDKVPTGTIEDVLGELATVRDRNETKLNKLRKSQIKEGK